MARLVETCGVLKATHTVRLLREHQPIAPLEKPFDLHLNDEGDLHSHGNDTMAAYSHETRRGARSLD